MKTSTWSVQPRSIYGDYFYDVATPTGEILSICRLPLDGPLPGTPLTEAACIEEAQRRYFERRRQERRTKRADFGTALLGALAVGLLVYILCVH